MLALPQFFVVALLAGDPQAPTIPSLRDERVEVVQAHQTIRGRIREIASDTVEVDTRDGPMVIPMASVQRINRVGDSVANGAAIGAAVGGGSALGILAKLCANNRCSDISASLDPRFVLMGTLVGAGIGALVDGLFERRTPLYRGRVEQPSPTAADVSPPRSGPDRVVVFGRAGRAQLTDDEGSLGSGGTWGTGVRVPIGERLGLQLAYDQQIRRRDFEFGRSYSGTERLATGKVLWFFRTNARVRPYAGIGAGVLVSQSRSDSPTWTLTPGNIVLPGALETSRSKSRSTVLGFATGADVRLPRHLSLVGDLTLDLGGRQAYGSTRLTLGAGWRF
jgi:hypothetical protein